MKPLSKKQLMEFIRSCYKLYMVQHETENDPIKKSYYRGAFFAMEAIIKCEEGLI